MNHRELVLSADKKARFAFLKLPEELQDQVIEGLDGQELTLVAARDVIKERGHTLSHEAIAAYYRAVRRERRIEDTRLELNRTLEAFADQPIEETLLGLTKCVASAAVEKLAAGDVTMKIDIGKMLDTLVKLNSTAATAAKTASVEASGSSAAETRAEHKAGLSAETIEMIKREIYGL